MTITIFNLRITIFRFEKIAHCDLSFDRAAAQREAEEIKQSDYFRTLRAQAQAVKASR